MYSNFYREFLSISHRSIHFIFHKCVGFNIIAYVLVPGLQRDARKTVAFIKCSLLISFQELNMDEKNLTTAWGKGSIYLCIFIAASFMQQHLSLCEAVAHFPKYRSNFSIYNFRLHLSFSPLVNYLSEKIICDSM